MTAFSQTSRSFLWGSVVLATVFSLVLGLLATSGTAAADPVAAGTAPESESGRFLVVGGTDSQSLAVMRVNRNGTLTKIRTVRTGLGVMSVKVARGGKLVYVGHIVEGAVSVYRLTDGGRLNRIQRIAVPGPIMTMQPSRDSRYMYLAMSGVPGRLDTYRIGASGRLSTTGHSVPMSLGSLAPMVTVDPNGRYVRAASAFDASIKSYRVAPGGRLVPLGTVFTGGLPAVNGNATPDGRFFYITHEYTGNVSGFRVLPNGDLAPIPVNFFSGLMSHEVMITPDGERAYVANVGSGGVAGYRIHRNGAMSPLPGSPYATGFGSAPALTVLHPNGRYAYAVDVFTPGRGTTHVHAFRIRPNGSLVKIGSTDMGLRVVDGPVAQMAG
ncbi:MAG: beta-propeller fold lactonase family protein [Gordonia sp. (in: high G+C Gram-positive bacteria)]|uniref:lactonase family protein n=1 Tax=Gordonia sp. (in: high G+C Gram-positive bacteria) TaxID=84139 RepID=UPI0039E35EBA